MNILDRKLISNSKILNGTHSGESLSQTVLQDAPGMLTAVKFLLRLSIAFAILAILVGIYERDYLAIVVLFTISLSIMLLVNGLIIAKCSELLTAAEFALKREPRNPFNFARPKQDATLRNRKSNPFF